MTNMTGRFLEGFKISSFTLQTQMRANFMTEKAGNWEN
jgi:hypothetical protein